MFFKPRRRALPPDDANEIERAEIDIIYISAGCRDASSIRSTPEPCLSPPCPVPSPSAVPTSRSFSLSGEASGSGSRGGIGDLA